MVSVLPGVRESLPPPHPWVPTFVGMTIQSVALATNATPSAPPRANLLRGFAASREPNRRPGPNRGGTPNHRRSFCEIGTIFTSTRRFAARPASVSFDAIGCVSPKPRVPIRAGCTPRLAR